MARRPLGLLLADVAARTTAPGGGASAAHTAALASALTAMAARFADPFPDSVPDAEAIAYRADTLRARAVELADADVSAYAGYVRARRAHRADLESALDAAVQVPLEVARIGAEVARVASRLVVDGNPRLRGDAATGCLLAAAAAGSAAVLVAENLAGRSDDPRVGQAREAAADARAAADTLAW